MVSLINIQKNKETQKKEDTVYQTGDKEHAKGRESTKRKRKKDNKYN